MFDFVVTQRNVMYR